MEYPARRRNNVVHGPPLSFEEEGRQGLGYFFYESCKKNAEKILQIDGQTGRSETYSTILSKSVRTAMEMRKIGIQKGDVISICSKNNMDSLVPVFAAPYLNAVVAAIDPSLSLRDSVYLLDIVRPKLMFAEASAMDLVEDILRQINFKMDVVVMGAYKKYLPFSQFLKEKENEEQFRPVTVANTNDVAVIFFSSGTTGMPKAIKCSHYGLLYGMYGIKQLQISGNATLHLSSFYWISAYITTLSTVVCGGYKVIFSVFEPTLIMNLIQKYKITFSFMASSTVYRFTKENTSGYDTSSMENIIFAGSAVSEEQLKKCKLYFPNALVSIGYGQSEASNFITIFSKKITPTLAKRYPGSCGVVMPGVSMKIVDPETEETLPPNQQGEVRILSKGVFIGYDKEDASSSVDASGFLKTGDLGYLNEDNCLYICDRLKDMFKYQCWHIVPASVEKVIYQHPAVQEAVVFGVPHPEDGDHPMALVVLKHGHLDVNEEDILQFVNANVLDREKLRAGVKIVTALPKTVTGKYIRRQIRKAVIEGIL